MALQRKAGARMLAALGAVALFATACGSDDPEPDDTESTDTGGAEDDSSSDGDDSESEDAEGASAEGMQTRDEYCTNTGGTLVWTHEQEPENMHLDDPNNNKSITNWIRGGMWEGLYGFTDDITFQPELLAEELEVVDNGDDTVTYNGVLRDGLTWSDGTAVTSENVKGTYDIIMQDYDRAAADDDDPETDPGGTYLIGSRDGYNLITEEGVVVDSDTEFHFTTAGFYAGFKGLFAEIFPSHVVTDAETANEVFQTFEMDGSPLPSSGPLLWNTYNQGQNLLLDTNQDYHGSTSEDVSNGGYACVDGVEIVFAADTDAQVNALRAQEADLIIAQPQTAFLELANSPDFEVASSAGPVYEHWSFNLKNEHLADPAVREAIAYGIDKSEVVNTLYAPLFGDLLPEAGLGQTYWMTNQPPYEDYQEQYAGKQTDEAKSALEGAGYDCSGDVCTHPDRGELTLRVGTTGGNRLREDQQQLIQAQLADAGINIEIDNVEGSAYFSEQPFSEGSVACYSGSDEGADCNIWDIAQFAWVGSPWPGGSHCTYQTACGNNLHSFSDPDYDAKTAECDAITDDDERASCYNELAAWVVNLETNPEQGLVVVPLTQKPSFYAYSTVRLEKGAVAPDYSGTGPLINVVDYVIAP